MLETPLYRYCPMCGQELVTKRPQADNRLRQMCEHCGFIRYVNPLPIVGTVPILDGKVLLCRRAIEPRKGFWTLPAGFMEGYETLKEGAARETLEETGEEVKVGELLTIIDVPDANQVHFFFRAELQDINGVPGEETLEQRLFSEEEIPWDMLSFTTVKTTLRHYFEDFHAGKFELHTYKLSK